MLSEAYLLVRDMNIKEENGSKRNYVSEEESVEKLGDPRCFSWGWGRGLLKARKWELLEESEEASALEAGVAPCGWKEDPEGMKRMDKENFQ